MENKDYLADIMMKKIIEAKREKLAERAREAQVNFRKVIHRAVKPSHSWRGYKAQPGRGSACCFLLFNVLTNC